MTIVDQMIIEISSNEREKKYIENIDEETLDTISELYEDGSIKSFRDIQIHAYIHVLHYFDFETETLLENINSEIDYEHIHFKNEGKPQFENNNGEVVLKLEIPQENYISMLLVDTFNGFIGMLIDNNVADRVSYSVV